MIRRSNPHNDPAIDDLVAGWNALRVGHWPTFFIIWGRRCQAGVFRPISVPKPRAGAGGSRAPRKRLMDVHDRITGIIGPTVESMGYDLVRVQLTGNARPTLQVMAERLDGAAMTVDDCAEISRAVSALMDVEDPIEVAYTLEVSSPGIDRPLTRIKDFERYAGFEVRVETSQAVDERRRFIGMLKGVEDGKVLVEMPTGPAAVPFDLILRAKLVMNDALLKAAAEGRHQH